jgi:hypothetical protein
MQRRAATRVLGHQRLQQQMKQQQRILEGRARLGSMQMRARAGISAAASSRSSNRK